jgi:hypothetical protein
VTKFEGTHMKLKLNFTEPIKVSSFQEKDKLEIKFIKTHLIKVAQIILTHNNVG